MVHSRYSLYGAMGWLHRMLDWSVRRSPERKDIIQPRVVLCAITGEEFAAWLFGKKCFLVFSREHSAFSTFFFLAIGTTVTGVPIHTGGGREFFKKEYPSLTIREILCFDR